MRYISKTNIYLRLEERMIAAISKAEAERLAAQLSLAAAEGATATVIEIVEAKAATLARANAAAQATDTYIHSRQEALELLQVFQALDLSWSRLSTSARIGLKRYLTVRELGQVVAASPARA